MFFNKQDTNCDNWKWKIGFVLVVYWILCRRSENGISILILVWLKRIIMEVEVQFDWMFISSDRQNVTFVCMKNHFPFSFSYCKFVEILFRTLGLNKLYIILLSFDVF
jgi:hypothetical protein